jgi:hypothetical protein
MIKQRDLQPSEIDQLVEWLMFDEARAANEAMNEVTLEQLMRQQNEDKNE